MITKAKEALGRRIRGLLDDRTAGLASDVVAALAEAAILLEVQCESESMLLAMVPHALGAVSRLVDAQQHKKTPREEIAFKTLRGILRVAKAQGADTPEKLFDMLRMMGIHADDEIGEGIFKVLIEIAVDEQATPQAKVYSAAVANGGNGCG